MTDLRYPVGKLERRDTLSPDERRAMIEQIAEAPGKLRAAVAGLSPSQLDTPYREGGWTVRQVVHHVADSHINAYTRMKFGLTEEHPKIRAYDEARWAETAENRTTPVETSLALLDSLHDRWLHLLRGMQPEDFRRTVDHPDNGMMTLDMILNVYAWHGRHHTAHVTSLRERMGW